MPMPSLTLTAIEGLPMVKRGDNLAELIVRALDQMHLNLRTAISSPFARRSSRRRRAAS